MSPYTAYTEWAAWIAMDLSARAQEGLNVAIRNGMFDSNALYENLYDPTTNPKVRPSNGLSITVTS